MVWTTDWSTFGERHYDVLDSLFFHHPHARVTVYANLLARGWRDASRFGRYVAAGYRVEVVEYNVDSMLALLDADEEEASLTGVREWVRRYAHGDCESCDFMYSHLSDFFRFAALYRFGGSYCDFDAVHLAPLDELRNAIGRDSSSANGECEWCFDDDGDTYLAPGMMIGWRAGHPMMREALRIGFDVDAYEPRCFNCAGPKAVTRAYKRIGDALRADIDVLEPYRFYPISWRDAERHVGVHRESAQLWRNVRDNALSLHLYGHMTRKLANIDPRSLFGLALRRYRLFSSGGGGGGGDDDENERGEAAAPEQDDGNVDVSKKKRRRRKGARNGRRRMFDVSAPESVCLSGDESVNVVRNVRVVTSLRTDPLARYTVTASSRRRSLRLLGGGGDNVQARSSLTFNGSALEVNRRLATLLYVHEHEGDADIDDDDHAHDDDERPASVAVGQDMLVVDVVSADGRHSARAVLELLEINKLVTLVSKTMGRMSSLDRLVDSARTLYPSLPVVTTNDGADQHTRPLETHLVRYVPAYFDAGLSHCRNAMVDAARTPFVLLVDDDFTFDVHSNLHVLVENALRHGFDIAAGKNPVDAKRFELDFCGRMRIDDGSLLMERGTYGAQGDCEVVDFAPNLFLARTEALHRVPWDERLKLGEHEDFFWRAKLANLKVGTCPSIAFNHHPSEHWLRRTWYDHMRQRVYTFFRIAMAKHGISKIVLFDVVVVDEHQFDTPIDPDAPVCSIGATGANCTECLPGYSEPHCSACLPGRFGIDCTECTCGVLGTCADGIDGDGSCTCMSPFSVGAKSRAGRRTCAPLTPAIVIIALVGAMVLCCCSAICFTASRHGHADAQLRKQQQQRKRRQRSKNKASV
jgi:(N-Acetylneuraminyl)-galactosylglucosylceramide N-acetylgalactosaminyltransferase